MPGPARERRKRRRLRTRQAASITTGDDAKPIACVLWDHSEKGARIAAAHANKLPDVFTLTCGNGSAPRLCRVRWRRGSLLGVRFVEPDEDADRPDAAPAPSPQAMDAERILEIIKLSAGAPRRGQGTTTIEGRSVSFLAAGFLLVLVALTIVLYLAGHESASGSMWGAAVCEKANGMCQHPEIVAGASVLMAIVYFTTRGMEL